MTDRLDLPRRYREQQLEALPHQHVPNAEVWAYGSRVNGPSHEDSEWQSVPFSEAVLVNPPVRLQRGTEYPFVDMAAVNPGSRWAYAENQRGYSGGGSRFQDGDTLMARITPCLENGKIARYRSIDGASFGHGSTEFIVVRGRPDVTDNDFAYYLTQSPEVRNYAISQMTGTSGRQRVPAAALDHIDVALPPLNQSHGEMCISLDRTVGGHPCGA